MYKSAVTASGTATVQERPRGPGVRRLCVIVLIMKPCQCCSPPHRGPAPPKSPVWQPHRPQFTHLRAVKGRCGWSHRDSHSEARGFSRRRGSRGSPGHRSARPRLPWRASIGIPQPLATGGHTRLRTVNATCQRRPARIPLWSGALVVHHGSSRHAMCHDAPGLVTHVPRDLPLPPGTLPRLLAELAHLPHQGQDVLYLRFHAASSGLGSPGAGPGDNVPSACSAGAVADGCAGAQSCRVPTRPVSKALPEGRLAVWRGLEALR